MLPWYDSHGMPHVLCKQRWKMGFLKSAAARATNSWTHELQNMMKCFPACSYLDIFQYHFPGDSKPVSSCFKTRFYVLGMACTICFQCRVQALLILSWRKMEQGFILANATPQAVFLKNSDIFRKQHILDCCYLNISGLQAFNMWLIWVFIFSSWIWVLDTFLLIWKDFTLS